jgi:hypothetical protein
MSDPIPTSRPRPVLFYGMFTAAVSAFLGFAGVSDLLPKVVIAWVALVYAVVGAGWAFYVQSVVTPLADPVDRDGTTLVRLPDALDAVLPPGTTTDDREVRDPYL